MKILISGSTGLVGSALVPFLLSKGHQTTRLVRSKSQEGIFWDPDNGVLERSKLEGFDGIIHLSGENIASGRWTPERKRRLWESRIKSTNLLAKTLSFLDEPPKTLISASAIGFYGSRGDELLKEDSAAGHGFLSDLCRAWENATTDAMIKGIRIVHSRFGIILSPKGGALAKMLLPFMVGVGGKLGSGKQFMSWVAMEDVLASLLHMLEVTTIKGPVNVVSPEPVTNDVYTRTLGHVLSRPTIFPMPAFAARFAFGEMADSLLLASQRVQPSVLLKTGYRFRYLALEDALKNLVSN
jgi:uncharacterized protein (TIGR01777 family)